MNPTPLPDGPEPHAPVPRPLKWLRGTESMILALALVCMVAIPLLEASLRKLFQSGISNASALLQHLTLVISLLGGALAAREGRLLALSTLMHFLPSRPRILAGIFSGAVACVTTFVLCAASIHFVQVERSSESILAYGLPIWIVQLVMPIGFALIALRLIFRSAPRWRQRFCTAALAAALGAALLFLPIAPEKLLWPAFALLLAATVLGAPIFVTLGGAALILFWTDEIPITAVALTQYSMVTNPSLPTIPLFTLAGYFLAEGGASRRLIAVFNAFFGRLRGGPAIVTVLLCAFFTSFTGASGVTILALGGLLMPILLSASYSERSALGLLTGSGSLGLLFPPSLPLILYAIIAASNTEAAGITIQKMFLGGLGPGLLLVGLTIAWGVRQGGAPTERAEPVDWPQARRTLWAARWELLVPVVALVSLFGGFATPVEAAAVTALYALLTQTVLHRDLHPTRDLPRVVAECGLLVGGILLILGVALGLTNYLVDAQVPMHAVEWVTTRIESKYLFLLVLNLCLLLVGCLMDLFSAIVVVVPLLVPIGLAYGIDPVHLGIIFLANMELGLLMPTVGINVLISSYRFKKSVLEVTRAVVPMQLVLFFGVLVITYLPPLTTLLPKWFAR